MKRNIVQPKRFVLYKKKTAHGSSDKRIASFQKVVLHISCGNVATPTCIPQKVQMCFGRTIDIFSMAAHRPSIDIHALI